MSFERPLPPPLPPQGFLLDELDYLEERLAAIALDLAPQTFTDYRKAGIGPEYTIVGRTILYSKGNLQKWLDAGGTRTFVENVDQPTLKLKLKAGAGKPKPAGKVKPAARAAATA
jgi:hypothetical protein